MNFMGAEIIPNHADYRLMSSRALKWLSQYSEPNLFLRAACSQMSLRTATVHFSVYPRAAGKTKYSFGKMFKLALDSIVSFSAAPLRIITFIGLAIFVFSAAMGCYVIYQALATGSVVPGWASITLPIYFLGGVQLLSLAIIGEYIAQALSTAKARPRFLIEEELF